MSGSVTLWRELHRLRRHVKNLRDEIERLPGQIKAQRGKVARQEELLRQAQENIKKMKVANSEKEKSLKSKHGDVAKYEKQRDEAAGKKEYDALQHEISAAQQACQQLEDEVLNGIMETDELTAQLPTLEKALKQAKDDLANFDQISAKRRTELTEELKRAEELLKEAETGVPEEVRAMYVRLVTARNDDALAAVQDRVCMACYTGITAQQGNELLQGMFVACKSCGRLLYRAE